MANRFVSDTKRVCVALRLSRLARSCIPLISARLYCFHSDESQNVKSLACEKYCTYLFMPGNSFCFVFIFTVVLISVIFNVSSMELILAILYLFHQYNDEALHS